MGSVLCFHLAPRNGSGRATIEEGKAGDAGIHWESLAWDIISISGSFGQTTLFRRFPRNFFLAWLRNSHVSKLLFMVVLLLEVSSCGQRLTRNIISLWDDWSWRVLTWLFNLWWSYHPHPVCSICWACCQVNLEQTQCLCKVAAGGNNILCFWVICIAGFCLHSCF